MKAILEFDLNDRDDIVAHYRCVKSIDLAMALWDLNGEIRSKLKYGELTDTEYSIYEKIKNTLTDIMEERGINLDHLII